MVRQQEPGLTRTKLITWESVESPKYLCRCRNRQFLTSLYVVWQTNIPDTYDATYAHIIIHINKPKEATTMKSAAVVLLLATSASAFAPSAKSAAIETRLHETPGKINHKIDLDSPKVATQEKLGAGDKKVYCRCWQSGTFPLCDGSHMKHNEATGDNVGPLIVSVAKAE
ncbi:hypothetical protein HJC23_000968 [Cyclotella cryptica]|uniref:Iron-binding zinc finger CDGSH type domain-containing protein n=1 Tax=Cyclotella cryptica TaxID=29204 RepID=A0ABD3QMP3_9STRA|eukprot:CCRYP_004094-RA/>CCRYP_004094-RA protein AED:0.41 eAED:0.41 QI:5/1/1/1/1/1/3/499/169